ncbi:MAG: DedA family protein [Terriglobia bacterium]
MAHHLFLSISHFFHLYGYWTIFAATLIEGAGIPIPGETVLLFAGFLARRGDIHLGWAIPAAVAGATIGALVGYGIGRLGGKAFLDAYRRRLFISHRVYDRSQAIFLRNAGWAILVARFIAGFRELLGIVAGVFRMDFWSFSAYNFAGAVLWSASISAIGFFVGNSWRRLVHLLARLDVVALAAFGAVVAVLAFRHWRRISREKTADR